MVCAMGNIGTMAALCPKKYININNRWFVSQEMVEQCVFVPQEMLEQWVLCTTGNARTMGALYHMKCQNNRCFVPQEMSD